jgi:AmmeMemoRadiSam system protein A
MYGDYIHISPGKEAEGDLSRFGAPMVCAHKQYDAELVDAICDEAENEGLSAGTMGEKDKRLDHGTLIPLWFIDRCYTDYKIVRVSVSGLSELAHYRFGICINRAAQRLGRSAVLVASGDLSHKLTEEGPYGYANEGPEFDKQLTEALKSADFMRLLCFDEAFTEAAAECGLRSFIEMAGALDGRAVKSELLSYEGPFGVGYAVCAFTAAGENENRRFADRYLQEEQSRLEGIQEGEDAYVRLARRSLETYIRTGKQIERPDTLPGEMRERRAGVFVSLKKHGKLRGCIGTISATAPCIADEIIRNAVSAGTGDPRFDPVTAPELSGLVYSVDVLGDAEPIVSMDELDPKRYGVIVSRGYRRGLLLPNLEGIDTPEQQVTIALQKAGISAGEKYGMERFEVVRHK